MVRRSSLAATALIVGLALIFPDGGGALAGPKALGQATEASYAKSEKKVSASTPKVAKKVKKKK
jgi:hypothetical protein